MDTFEGDPRNAEGRRRLSSKDRRRVVSYLRLCEGELVKPSDLRGLRDFLSLSPAEAKDYHPLNMNLVARWWAGIGVVHK